MKSISLLGSTGSIGTQSLQVVDQHPDAFSITALTAYQNDILLEQQIEKFQPKLAVLVDQEACDRLVRRYKGKTTILSGQDGLLEAATHPDTDVVITAMVGFSGLRPTIAAIKSGKTIALANKETLVAAGEIIMPLAKEYHANIIPVDSEHCAIMQCLQNEPRHSLKRLLITASGGPFRDFSLDQMSNIVVADCLKHPNWTMGKKITIDSATLANKGLEVIEAHWLFDVDYNNIEVVIHPQSIIHSMVEFVDGSTMAQLGAPDMRIPIQYALTFPDRHINSFSKLDIFSSRTLSFAKPENEKFPALSLAYQAGITGGTMPCVFNAANEVAVYAFMNNQIAFTRIPVIINDVMQSHTVVMQPKLDDIFSSDSWARNIANDIIKSVSF